VVTPQEGNPVFIAHLQRQQHEEGLDTVPSAVHVIPQEDVVSVGRVPADLEQLQQVVQLPVNVSTDGDWGAHPDGVGLSLQDFLGQLAQLLDGGLLDLLPPLDLLDYLLSHLPRTHIKTINISKNKLWRNKAHHQYRIDAQIYIMQYKVRGM
jgi:hypothetical protein